MKISLNWLNEYLNIKDIPFDEFLHRLTMAGIEVEGVEDLDGDKIIDVEITPNRADCLSIYGIARDIGCLFQRDVCIPKTYPLADIKDSTENLIIEIENKDECYFYQGVLFNEFTIKEFNADKLKNMNAVDVRGINNLVDVTNYSLWENGHPLHVFDFDKVIGGKIVVRRAKKGEKIVTLDDEEHELDESMLVIADAERPIAIAGIKGGKATEVTDSTKRVLLEAAVFDPVLIRRARRKLGISTDSSYRFERGTTIDGAQFGSTRAVQLLIDEAQATPAEKLSSTTDNQTKQPTIQLSLAKIDQFLGIQLDRAAVADIFQRLGFDIQEQGDEFNLTPPYYRSDIKEDVDCLEEIARMQGYDQLPITLPSIPMVNMKDPQIYQCRQQLRAKLLGSGFNEAVTFSLTNQDQLQKTTINAADPLCVTNPLSQDYAILRPSLLPSLLNVLEINLNRGNQDISLFEFGKIYSKEFETEVIGFLAQGRGKNNWQLSQKKQRLDFFEFKGRIENLFLNHKGIEFSRGENPLFDVTTATQITVDDQVMGSCGVLNPKIIKQWGLKEKNIFYAEIKMSVFTANIGQTKHFQPFSEYPSITRDISLAVTKDVDYQTILKEIQTLQSSLIHHISFIEEYCGEKIPADQRGLVFSLTYQSIERTLLEEEVQQEHQKVLDLLQSKFSVVYR